MKELLFSNEVTLEDERIMKLDYSLIENASEKNQIPYYGVSITRYLGDVVESDEIKGISESKEAAVLIIKKLCQFQVTPISMVEIVDELVTQGI